MRLNKLHAITSLLMLSLLMGCSSESATPEDPPTTSNFISGSITDRSTGLPIQNALVKTVPPTEIRLTDKNGGYLVRNSVFAGDVFDVIASQIGYGTETQRVTVGADSFSNADFSMDTEINGLVASLTILEIAQGRSSGTFLLSSTLDNTGFSFQSTNPAFRVEPSQGTLSKNELMVIQVIFTPPADDGSRITGQLVANANNGGTPVEINVAANVSQPVMNDDFAVLVDDNNELVPDISGSETGVLLDSPGMTDEPPVVPASTISNWNFESGQQNWSADNGLWEVGAIPPNPDTTAGSIVCQQGTQCAGTVLSGNYPAGTSSRFVSPIQILPTVSGDERLTFRFWQRFAHGSGDASQIQLSIDNGSNWLNVGSRQSNNSSVWSRRDVDITEYAGQSVRLAFLHIADRNSSINIGWYLDSISILRHSPAETGDFEQLNNGVTDSGWSDWGADNGVWEIGTISTENEMEAPPACYAGSQCAGTVLNDNYPAGTSSRMVSSVRTLPTITGSQRLTLRYWQWFSWGGGDGGQIQLTQDNGLNWTNLGSRQSVNSQIWTIRDLDLTDYAGQSVQIGFLHFANRDSSVSKGWFIDEVAIIVQ